MIAAYTNVQDLKIGAQYVRTSDTYMYVWADIGQARRIFVNMLVCENKRLHGDAVVSLSFNTDKTLNTCYKLSILPACWK